MDERDRERCERLAQGIGEWGAMPDFLHAVRERGVRGSSQTSVYRYVKAQIVPGIDFLVEAADVLGVRRSWLLFGEGEQTEAEQATRPQMSAMRAMSFDDPLDVHGPAVDGLVLQAIQQLFLADPDGPVPQGPELELLETMIMDIATAPLNRFRPAGSDHPDEIRASLMATLQGVVLSIPGRRQGRPIADLIGEGEGLNLIRAAEKIQRVLGDPDAAEKVQGVLADLEREIIEHEIIERRTRPVAEPSGEGVEER